MRLPEIISTKTNLRFLWLYVIIFPPFICHNTDADVRNNHQIENPIVKPLGRLVAHLHHRFGTDRTLRRDINLQHQEAKQKKQDDLWPFHYNVPKVLSKK